VNLFKRKTSLTKKMANQALSFFYFLKKTSNKALSLVVLSKKNRLRQFSLDKKLVYSLSPKKIPSGEQLKHINKFLKPKEYLVIKVCLLLILVNVIYLGTVFFRKNLVYLPVYGGEYVEGLISYPRTINPLYAVNRDVDSDLSRLIYSSLFKYDQHGALKNDLADQVTTTSNKEYLIKIKEDVKWHDGQLLTINDVIFTIEAIKNSSYRSPLRSSFVGIEIEKIDELTMKISLSSPYAPFLEVLAFGILPKHIWENINPDSAIISELNLKPIGSGPYKFKSFIKNKEGSIKEYNLISNNDYFAKQPFIKNIKFIFFPNYSEAVRALNDNKIDGLGYLPLSERSELLAKDSLSLHEPVRPQVFALFFNYTKDKALSDKVVRESLAKAINKKELIDNVFSGIYQPAHGPILENNFAYNHEVAIYEYNQDEAATNIKNKLASTSLTVVDSGKNVAVVEQIKKYWEAIGLVVDVKVIPGEKAAEIIKNRDFEILFYGESVGGDPDVYAFWHSSQIKENGLNIAGYNNAEADQLLTEAREITDINERTIKYKKFQENIATNLPAIFLYSPTYTYVQSKKVKGFESSVIIEPADRFVGIVDWYLKTKTKLAW